MHNIHKSISSLSRINSRLILNERLYRCKNKIKTQISKNIRSGNRFKFNLKDDVTLIFHRSKQHQNILSSSYIVSSSLKSSYLPKFKYYLAIIVFVCSWYTASLGMVAINKLMFDHLKFNFPIIVSLFHFTSTACFLNLVMKLLINFVQVFSATLQ